MDEATRAFFRRQQEDPENQSCVDCGSANPQWASVSHGCYISLESSGVHRSLGVHISFVRSTTMDSWKPIHLKLMELGGNRKLKEFFKQHNIPDDMPIVQKYNTRAAEWYRRNLRALADGTEPPPPLPSGTGHLPVSDVPSTTQIAFAKAAASGTMSAGGAFASDTRHFVGSYHDAGAASPARGSEGSSPPTRIESTGSVGSSGRRMEGFGSDGAVSQPVRDDSNSDFFAGFLGPEVGSKVSTGVWSTVGVVASLASKAKSFAENKVAQAQTEGWIDTALDTAKQGVGVAVDTTTWAAQKGVEATKATYTFVNEGGGKAVLGKTTEVLGTTAKTSASLVGSGVDWFAEQLGGPGADNSAGLQGMSSGKMQGFGSDSVGSTQAAAPAMRDIPRVASGSRPSYHADLGADTSGRLNTSVPAPVSAVSAPTATKPATATSATKGGDFFNDEDWGAWK